MELRILRRYDYVGHEEYKVLDDTLQFRVTNLSDWQDVPVVEIENEDKS